ncbi:MAG: hypothetical protein ACLRVN_01150 [Butyricicoccus sp.]
MSTGGRRDRCGHGETLFEQNADSRLPMASTTKIMTALVALGEVTDRVYTASGAPPWKYPCT